jgi:hypothetical protein
MQDLLPNKIALCKSARKKNRTKKKIRGRNSRGNSAHALERHLYSVYSGQIWLGNIDQRGNAYTAKTIRGKPIGTFDSLKGAAGAVSDTAEAAA